MTKKQYISPKMEAFEMKIQQRILFGSEVDRILSDGLDTEDIVQEDVKEEDPQSIWNQAW